MKTLKILFSVLLLLLLREPIFRLCVAYDPLGTVPIPALQDQQLKADLRVAALSLPDYDIYAWTDFAQQFTANHTQFHLSANSSIPDQVWRNGKAHCVGYAAFTGAVLQEIINQKEAYSSYEVEHVRADLYLFGFRLTGPNRSPSFRDHDCIRVVVPESTDNIWCDPSLYDFTWIRRI